MVHNNGPTMQIVSVFLQLRWSQICVGENPSTEHARRLLQILSFDASETKTNVGTIHLFIFNFFDMMKDYDGNKKSEKLLLL